MNISHPNNFVYWAIPHTGCETIFNALNRHYGLEGPEKADGTRPLSYEIAIPEDSMGYTFVLSIRNPYQRLIAYWEQFKAETLDSEFSPEHGLIKANARKEIQEFIEKNPDDFSGFVAFLFKNDPEDDREKRAAKKARRACVPSQAALVSANYAVHYHIRYEQLDRSFGGLPFVNERVKVGIRSNTDHWKKLYTPEARRLVSRYWEDDFCRFSYPMELD